MRAILEWFVLSVVILGAGSATSVRQERHRLGVASEPAIAQLLRTGGGPVLASATEDEDAISGLWEGGPWPERVPQASDGPYGPATASFQDRRLVSEAWIAGRYPLLVEDTDRYWLVGTAARQLAGPDVGLAGPEVTRSGGIAALPTQPVTWLGEVVLPAPNERRLLVDQGAQVMYVYEGGAEVRALPVSTGMLTSRTFTRAWIGLVGQDLGAATVDGGMRAEQAWYLFPDLFGNILLHTLPYVEQGSMRIYDQPEALGVRPSSHGCVRVSAQDAQWLKEWGPVGVPIEITAPSGPIRQVE